MNDLMIAIVDDHLPSIEEMQKALQENGYKKILPLHVGDQDVKEIAQKVMPAQLILLDEDLEYGRKTGKTGARVREELLKKGFPGKLVSISNGIPPWGDRHYASKMFLPHRRAKEELVKLVSEEIGTPKSSF